jgi:hypothetical protein
MFHLTDRHSSQTSPPTPSQKKLFHQDQAFRFHFDVSFSTGIQDLKQREGERETQVFMPISVTKPQFMLASIHFKHKVFQQR